ncbi:MAG: hypothetical protein EXR21_10250 [Flavobacteriaceae bacterium]|nr:hypothetical protein [Flavobacteriaceae bacterium]
MGIITQNLFKQVFIVHLLLPSNHTNMINTKTTIAQKFLAFEKSGLEKYAKYLSHQQQLWTKKGNATSYLNYIEKQIAQTEKKLKAIDEKLA